MEIGKEFVKEEEEDKALLIEDGGGLQAASPKAKASSVHSPLIRLYIYFSTLKEPVVFVCCCFFFMLILGVDAGLFSWMSPFLLRIG